uniref:Uncharacterized protein n=1 Tax=Arundo donax TaxID=35708 RepID=A0A0A9AIT0_ARUDO
MWIFVLFFIKIQVIFNYRRWC